MKRNKVIDETISQASLFYNKATGLNTIGSLLLVGYALLLVGCALILLKEQINTAINLIKDINLKDKK